LQSAKDAMSERHVPFTPNPYRGTLIMRNTPPRTLQ